MFQLLQAVSPQNDQHINTVYQSITHRKNDTRNRPRHHIAVSSTSKVGRGPMFMSYLYRKNMGQPTSWQHKSERVTTNISARTE